MVNALHCDVWVVCACIAVCNVACFIGFLGIGFGGSASLHEFVVFFFWGGGGGGGGGGNKCVGVNVSGGWCWNGTCLRMLCVV